MRNSGNEAITKDTQRNPIKEKNQAKCNINFWLLRKDGNWEKI